MLAKLLGSRLRAKVLGWLFSHPDERFYVRQLESILEEDATNIGRELARLAAMGIVTRKIEGRQKYYRASSECPIFHELQGLVIKTVGVADVLRSALTPLADRIEVAFIFGSMARGGHGVSSDVDLLVVGEVTFPEVVSAVGEAQERLGREVNPSVYPREEFLRKRAAGHYFLRSVLGGRKVFLIGGESELGAMAEERVVDGA